MDRVYTSGDVAKIIKVAPRTACKLGKLQGEDRLKYYLIPGCNHRRVRHNELVRFMRHHGMPLEFLLDFLIHDGALEDATAMAREHSLTMPEDVTAPAVKIAAGTDAA